MTVSRLLPRLALMLLVAFLAACASGPRITSDTNPQADFSQFRTYAFYSPLAVETHGYTTMASNTMRAAARREMEARGYVYDETAPDLLVNINAYLEEKVDVHSYPYMGYGAYYGYRGGYYGGVGGWWPDYGTHEYTEGTLNVDLVDADARTLVWEGIAVGRIARMQPAERAARINSTMTEIFAAFPHRAGN